MTKGTRNVIKRLKKLIRENSEAVRRYKARVRTPWDQRAPGPISSDLSDLATLLCMTRAEMRGKKHFIDKEYDQKAFIEEGLKKAEKWEQQRVEWNASNAKLGRAHSAHATTHPALPQWLRNTIRAALLAGDVERHRQAQHAPRKAAGEEVRLHFERTRKQLAV